MPGNPMRAVLRALGRRNSVWLKLDRAERAATDRAVRILIRVLHDRPQLPAAWPVGMGD